MLKFILRSRTFVSLMLGIATSAAAASYHIDGDGGSDLNDGLSPDKAWATLKKASDTSYKGADRILLKRGTIYNGKLALSGVRASKERPLFIGAYGDSDRLPIVNSAGYIGGVTIEDCAFVEVADLAITSDGGNAIDKEAHRERFGLYVSGSENISIDGLDIYSVFASIATKSEGKTKLTAYGHGVRSENSRYIRIENCDIQKVGRYGINARKSNNIEVLNNKTDHTGCSGIQLSVCNDVVIRGNTFDHPGSFIDDRMHGRGSGSWVWGCENVLYEKNHFLNAKGKADSCGVHIDFNCKNIVIQHCFSMNNEGGFIEILGNNHNCAYRYNISVNDGARTKGKHGAHQEGKVFWLSGFRGRKNSPSGPFNSYIYNNTIYVKEGAPGRFSITPTAKGALVANNIFHLLGPNSTVKGDQKKYRNTNRQAEGIVFTNNVYIKDAALPDNLGVKDGRPIIGDAQFRQPGGVSPEDYIPQNEEILKNRGISILKLEGDEIGLTLGLDVKQDFFGTPIDGIPDIGAVEFTTSTQP